MTKVVGVRFSDTGKMYYFDPKGFDIKNGQEIIVETANGLEFGKTSTGVKLVEHNLEMNLTNAEYSFDCSKVIFYFTADGRIDFRELVKDLASTLHTRIELRQIGVRDESKMLGGLGICGRPFCCSTFLDGFHSVTIKMAKDQGLSLAPGKISGTCGRLMCCLKYEQNSYEYLHKITPKVGTVVDCRHGRGTVVDAAILTGKLKIQLDNTPDGLPVIVNREEVRIVRDNKQKVNKI